MESLHGLGGVLRCRNPREDPEYSGETVTEIVRVLCLNFRWCFSSCSLGHIRLARRAMQVVMDEDEVGEGSEVRKSIDAWRQSERMIMIETVQDLIQTSHKYAKSQYTPNAQRVRWTKLAGQLIWYKDQILKNFSLEAMTVQLEALQKRMEESEEGRQRQSVSRNYPTIVFPKPKERNVEDADKAQDGESAEAGDPEGAKEVA